MKKTNDKTTNEHLFSYGLILYAFGAVVALTLPVHLGEAEKAVVTKQVKTVPVLAACSDPAVKPEIAGLAQASTQAVSAKAEVSEPVARACAPVSGAVGGEEAAPVVAPAVATGQAL